MISLVCVEFTRVSTNPWNLPKKKYEYEAKRSLHSPRPKTFDLVWSETTWLTVKNCMQDAPYLTALPGGYGVAVMYTSARNHLNPYIPTASFANENYWPVQIRHYSNGKTNFIYIHKE